MEYVKLHEWPDNANDAVRVQETLRKQLILESRFDRAELVAAVDTAYNDKINRLYAAAVTVRLPEMNDIERSVAEMEAKFDYIPALLSFREGPVILKVLSRLQIRPDVVIFAGHGLAHPRSFGLASHMGLLVDMPSIGCARKLLSGEFNMPDQEQGACSPLYVANVKCGYVYRTKSNVKPMFISPGHLCSIPDALAVVKKCLTEYRMPEPLRLAHLFASKYKQSAERKLGLRKPKRQR
ncbi:MAG: endonuclease V [Candidatus Zixiibacteriota bacterium]|nr:MAG: endonuclease V [candidate division Zixibacteria bacterium]